MATSTVGPLPSIMSHRWRVLAVLSLLLGNAAFASAQVATLPFTDCTSGLALNATQKINVTNVYGQITTNDEFGKHLNLTVIGDTGDPIIPVSNVTSLQGMSEKLLGGIVTCADNACSYDVHDDICFVIYGLAE